MTSNSQWKDIFDLPLCAKRGLRVILYMNYEPEVTLFYPGYYSVHRLLDTI